MPDKVLQILMVEDNPGDVRLLTEMLKEARDASYKLYYAGRLSEGLEVLTREKIDLILLDLSLPDSMGFESFRTMFSHAPRMPIIIMTGTNDQQLAVQAVREGAQDYLVKNEVDGNLLFRAMRYAIERKQTEEEVKTLSRRIIEIQEEERNRISREIHDVLGQSLIALKFQVQNILYAHEDNPGLTEDCEKVTDYINQIVKEARELSHSLSPLVLKNLGLNRAIEELARTFESGHEIKVDVNQDHMELFFPESWDINVYRIIQEACINAHKHARATRIEIIAKNEGEQLHIIVRDNGRGIRASQAEKPREAKSEGLGLLIMKERARILGAGLNVVSPETGGTEVIIEINR